MTITTYTDREIALQAQLAAMTASRDEYQQAADKMAWDHKVERDTLRQHIKHIGNDALRSENHELRQQLEEMRDELYCTEESLDAASAALPEKYNEKFSNGFECMGDFALTLGVAFTSEISDLRQQLAEAQAAIEASRKQEPVARYIGECSDGSLVQLLDDPKKGADLFAAPQAVPAGQSELNALLHEIDTQCGNGMIPWLIEDAYAAYAKAAAPAVEDGV
jgi:hypothetical protein